MSDLMTNDELRMLAALGLFIVLLVLLNGTCWLISLTRFGCRLGWHDGKAGLHTFDGCNDHAECSKCGKHVMQDSNGDWF